MKKRQWVVLACAGAFGILFAPSSAGAAQPEPPPTSTATQSAPPTAAVPAPTPVVPAVSSPNAPSEPIASEPSTKGVFSLALERFAGISVTGGKQGDPIVVVGLGQGNGLGYGLGRLGLDHAFANGFSIGVGVALAILSSSSSLTAYGLTPRIGYRIVLSKHVDLVPRLGFALNGASTKAASEMHLGAEVSAPVVFRLTDSFNLLLGPEGTIAHATLKTTGIVTVQDAMVWSVGAWAGVGGYL